MKHDLEVDLLRLLNGELPAAKEQELRRRLEREPELAEVFSRLERAWSGLALPPPSPVPPGFGGRVMANVRELRELHAAGGPAGAGSRRRAAPPHRVGRTAAAGAPARGAVRPRPGPPGGPQRA